MSGHSKWSTIKHKKGALDAKRGKLFTKLSKEIIVAARDGGGESESNFKLRLAIQNAKDANMPNENIERSIAKGSGKETGGSSLEEITYEAYGPGGSALLIQALTDNRNRTAAEVRSTLTKNSGNLAETGSVSWGFESKGTINIETDKTLTEETALSGIDQGAEDFEINSDVITFYTTLENFEDLRKNLTKIDSAKLLNSQIEMVPKSFLSLEKNISLKTLKLMENLEDLDDVQKVFSNIDITDEIIESFENEN